MEIGSLPPRPLGGEGWGEGVNLERDTFFDLSAYPLLR
jgi:hypothetical protein